jgi:hypothetical protein
MYHAEAKLMPNLCLFGISLLGGQIIISHSCGFSRSDARSDVG